MSSPLPSQPEEEYGNPALEHLDDEAKEKLQEIENDVI